jgi:hypothetical protein
MDFDSNALLNGSIKITAITSESISGEFTVTLQDDYNGSDVKSIAGGFTITADK